jgi:hypothetical protein
MFNTEDTDADKDLLAELNGEAATPEEAKELAAAEKAAKLDPLKIVPKAKKSAAKRLEEAAVKQEGPLKGYAVTVRGLYTAPAKDAPGKKVKKDYEIVANVPVLEGALSTIKNKLLDKMLRMKYPGYVTFLTHEITDVRPLGANTPPADNVAYMNAEDLKAHIRMVRAPITVDEYEGDIVGLRAAVVDFTLNPKGFSVREAKRLADRKETRELEALNKLPS